MANTVSKDDRWTGQSGSKHPDNSENKRINRSVKSTYAPDDRGDLSENGRIKYSSVT